MPRLCRTPVRNESLQFMREWSSNRSRSCAASVCQRRSVRQSLTACSVGSGHSPGNALPYVHSSSSSNQCCLRDAGMDCVFLLQSYLWVIPFLGVILPEYERLREQGRSRTPVCTSANYVQIVNMWHPFAAKLRGRGEGGGVGKQRGGSARG